MGQFTLYRAISAGVSLQTGAGDYCVDQVVKHCQILLSSGDVTMLLSSSEMLQ